jgi:succinoglycan biosynthesis transport protein ExoP
VPIAHFARVVRVRWRLVALVALASIIAASTYIVTVPRKYTASTTMYVATQTSASASGLYQGSLLAQQRVKSYVALATSNRVTREVVAALRLPVSPEELASSISASSPENSILLTVSAVDTDAQAATNIANSVGQKFVTLVNELEAPVPPSTVQPVEVRIVQPATLPASPSSSSPATIIALGLLVGLTLGGGAAWLAQSVDTTIRTSEQLESALGTTTLGTTPYEKSLTGDRTAATSPTRETKESFKRIRTNLDFVCIDEPTILLLVSSSLPGEGKTTTALELSSALSATGKSTLLIDADLRKPQLAQTLGLETAVGLTTVLTGGVLVSEAVQRTQLLNGVGVLTTGVLPPNPSELLASDQMRQLLEDLRASYDVIVIDTPPALPVTDAAAVAHQCDGVLFVCRYGLASTAQVAQAAKSFQAASARLLGSVLTAVPSRAQVSYGSYSGTYDPATSTARLTAEEDEDAPTEVFDNPRVRDRPVPSPRSRR